MKALATIEVVKKYLPGILYTILCVFVLFVLYKAIIRFKGGAMAVGGVIADTAENNTISNNTGVTPSRVNELRALALSLSKEMETFKDMSWLSKQENVIFDGDILDIMRGIKSANEMIIVKNFYTNIFTNSHILLDDLREELPDSKLSQIPNIQALY